MAVRRLIADGVDAEDVDEAAIAARLYTGGMPDPDLVIRSGGDMRVSNFLLWQCAYSELYFTNAYWPDFGREDIDIALAEYGRRKRRFGGLSDTGDSGDA
jgi:undecaprenyl diphosphate synthase